MVILAKAGIQPPRVIPAKAGIQLVLAAARYGNDWIPAFAGMTFSRFRTPALQHF